MAICWWPLLKTAGNTHAHVRACTLTLISNIFFFKPSYTGSRSISFYTIPKELSSHLMASYFRRSVRFSSRFFLGTWKCYDLMHVEIRGDLRYRTKLSRTGDSGEILSLDLSASVSKAEKLCHRQLTHLNQMHGFLSGFFSFSWPIRVLRLIFACGL